MSKQLNLVDYFEKCFVYLFHVQWNNDAAETETWKTDWHVMCIVIGNQALYKCAISHFPMLYVNKANTNCNEL